MPERRKFKRVPFSTSISFREVELPPKVKSIPAKAVNVSGGGIFINCENPFPEGSLLELHLEIAGRPGSFRVIGRVVWCSKTGKQKGMDIQFYRMSKKDRDELMACAKKGKWHSPPQD